MRFTHSLGGSPEKFPLTEFGSRRKEAAQLAHKRSDEYRLPEFLLKFLYNDYTSWRLLSKLVFSIDFQKKKEKKDNFSTQERSKNGSRDPFQGMD